MTTIDTASPNPLEPNRPLLAQALARLLGTLGPNPAAPSVGPHAHALIARLDQALPHQVFSTADAVRDALAASIPALRNAHGLNLMAQQSLMRQAMESARTWSPAHHEAWVRGIMNPVERQAAMAARTGPTSASGDDVEAFQATASMSRPQDPSPRPVRRLLMLRGSTPEASAETSGASTPMDDGLVEDRLLQDTVQTLKGLAGNRFEDLATAIAPFAAHLRHLPVGSVYVTVSRLREQVLAVIPDLGEAGHPERLTGVVRSALLAHHGAAPDSDAQNAILAATIPGAFTHALIQRWTTGHTVHQEADQARINEALDRLMQHRNPETMALPLNGRATPYRRFLLLDGLRDWNRQHGRESWASYLPIVTRTCRTLPLAEQVAVALAMRPVTPSRRALLVLLRDEDPTLMALFEALLDRLDAFTQNVVTMSMEDPVVTALVDQIIAVPALRETLEHLARVGASQPARSSTPDRADRPSTRDAPDGMVELDELDLDGTIELDDQAPDPSRRTTLPATFSLAHTPYHDDDPAITVFSLDDDDEDQGNLVDLALVNSLRGLDAVQDVVQACLDTPIASPGDLLQAMGVFSITTLTWSEPWFLLACHTLARTVSPSVLQHLGHTTGPLGLGDSGEARSPHERDLDRLGVLMEEALPPGFGRSRRSSQAMQEAMKASPEQVLGWRLQNAPLHDPEVEDRELHRVQVQEAGVTRVKKVQVLDDKVREFRNSKTYEVLHEGVDLRPVGVDLPTWQDGLDVTFPWMRPLTARLARRLAIQQQHNLPVRLPNLALLGDPGVGKTLYWRMAMRALNHPLSVLTLSGSNDSMAIKGTTAGWSTERPGIAAHTMALERCANPVILLDEIDKAGGGDNNGRAVDSLLPLLEASTAEAYRDDCLQQEVDTSRISWVLTLNEEDKLGPALRSRVEVIEVKGPDWSNPEHVEAALKMGEDLAWKTWGEDLRTPATRLSDVQKDLLRRTRWKSLRSLGQAIAEQLETNLYEVTVEARLTPGLGHARLGSPAQDVPDAASWRPASPA